MLFEYFVPQSLPCLVETEYNFSATCITFGKKNLCYMFSTKVLLAVLAVIEDGTKATSTYTLATSQHPTEIVDAQILVLSPTSFTLCFVQEGTHFLYSTLTSYGFIVCSREAGLLSVLTHSY